jgi:hypothetical protein
VSRQRERGTAILITMIITIALLGGGAVLVGMQMSSTRSTDVTRSNMTALYCAEAGLNAARKKVGQAYTTDGTWGSALVVGSACTNDAGCSGGALCIGVGAGSFCITQPAYLDASNIDHDLDAADAVTTDDFKVMLVDNEDEIGFANNYGLDNDLQLYIISTCTKFPDNKKQVRELIRYKPAIDCPGGQLGGCGGNSNENPGS